jgi:hypothetical protein
MLIISCKLLEFANTKLSLQVIIANCNHKLSILFWKQYKIYMDFISFLPPSLFLYFVKSLLHTNFVNGKNNMYYLISSLHNVILWFMFYAIYFVVLLQQTTLML